MAQIPRIPFDDLPPSLAEIFKPRVARLGYFGEFFQCAAHQPEALASFYRFTEDLKHALLDRLTEVVALTVATQLGNAYERHQHERLCLKLGFDERWVRAVEALPPDDHGSDDDHGTDDRGNDAGDHLQPVERAVQRLALAMIARNGHDTSVERDAVIASIGHAQAVGVIMLVGRYVAHALMVNCLDLDPPVASPFGERT